MDAEVPAAQALPGRPGVDAELRADERVDAGGDRRAHRVPARGRPDAHQARRVRRRASVAPTGTFVRYGGPDAAPVVTDGPFPEAKELIAGWYLIDVESEARAHEIAAYVSSAPGPGGEPIYEWIEVREVMTSRRPATERASDRARRPARAGLGPAGARRPRPPRQRLRGGRGRRAGRPRRGVRGTGPTRVPTTRRRG